MREIIMIGIIGYGALLLISPIIAGIALILAVMR